MPTYYLITQSKTTPSFSIPYHKPHNKFQAILLDIIQTSILNVGTLGDAVYVYGASFGEGIVSVGKVGEHIEVSITDITNVELINRSTNCYDYADKLKSSVCDVTNNKTFSGSVQITLEDDKCRIVSNAIPDHDFHDGQRNFDTAVSEQNQVVEIPASPSMAQSVTSLSLSTDNAVFSMGLKLIY